MATDFSNVTHSQAVILSVANRMSYATQRKFVHLAVLRSRITTTFRKKEYTDFASIKYPKAAVTTNDFF